MRGYSTPTSVASNPAREVLVLALLMFFILVGRTALGALTGLVVGLLFGDAIAAGLAAFSIAPIEPTHLGAFLAFVTGFFSHPVYPGKRADA